MPAANTDRALLLTLLLAWLPAVGAASGEAATAAGAPPGAAAVVGPTVHFYAIRLHLEY